MRRIIAVGFLAVASMAVAAVPEAEIVNRKLATIYRIAPARLDMPHRDAALNARIKPILIRQAGYLRGLLKPIEVTTGGLSLTASGSNEHSIRPNARTACALAMMVRFMDESDFPTTNSMEQCRKDALGILAFLLPTHGAGGEKCKDGKQWRGQWQTALWANSAGLAAWLLWDDLTDDQRWLAARMVCDEADRFVGVKPPSQVKDDTKAEENAWNSTVISLAACMFPDHPRHKEYAETARRWGLGSFIRQADIAANPKVDGKTLKEWDLGPTIHDDYTLENHNRVHPDYMNTINLNLDQWFPYEMAGKELPEAFKFNTRQVYGTLRGLTFPDAGYLYINGQDWQLHRNCNWFPNHLTQAIFHKDAGACLMAMRSLETSERMMARTADAGVFLPEEYSFASTQGDFLEMYADMYLMISRYGMPVEPESEPEYWKSLAGFLPYKAGNFVVARTEKSVATFSWGGQPMGMVMPMQRDLIWPPNERSLIGEVQISDVKKERPKVISATMDQLDDRVVVRGELSRAEGALRQRFQFTALSDGRVVYVDDVRVTTGIPNLKISSGLIPVLNDRNWVWHDGERTLYFNEGSKVFRAGKETDSNQSHDLPESPWYNIDDCLGIVADHAKPRYTENHKIGNGRLEQIFKLKSFESKSEVPPDSEPVIRMAVVFYPGADHKLTEKAAEGVKFDIGQDGRGHVELEDGKQVPIDLTHGGDSNP